MNVRQLIDALSKIDPELEVSTYSDIYGESSVTDIVVRKNYDKDDGSKVVDFGVT